MAVNQDIYDALRPLPGLIDNKFKADNRTIDAFERNVIKIQNDLMRRTLSLVSNLEIDSAGNIISSADNIAFASKSLGSLRRSLTQSGYGDLVADYVVGYEDQIENIVAISKGIGIDLNPSALNPQELQSLQGNYLSEFEAIGDRAMRQLQTVIYNSTLNGSELGTMIDGLGKVIVGTDKKGGQLKNHAKTYAQTSLMGYDRFVTNRLGQEAGLDNYLYLGPNDAVTRKFCRRHVNKSFTLEEIKNLDNGQGLPVLQFQGGWNCRHLWQLITKATAQEIGKNGLVMIGPDSIPKPLKAAA